MLFPHFAKQAGQRSLARNMLVYYLKKQLKLLAHAAKPFVVHELIPFLQTHGKVDEF
jgi:hypothetical protein